MTPATRAAVEVARGLGLAATDPELLHETNNTVVWLRPQPVVAKVATRPDARDAVRLEHAVAVELVAAGAEVGVPLPGATPVTHEETGFVVTLWQRLERLDRSPSSEDLLRSLERLHAALAETRHELPSFRTDLVRARTALDDVPLMGAVRPDDRTLLRATLDGGLEALADIETEEHRLHGEPHEGNRLLTAEGIRWIDFESCCVGPREWDQAFLPRELDGHLPGADPVLLALLRRVNSARVATWCGAQARFPEMRRHGEHHLSLLRG